MCKMINNLDDLKAVKTRRYTDQLRQTLSPPTMLRVPMKNKLALASSRASLMEAKTTSQSKNTRNETNKGFKLLSFHLDCMKNYLWNFN